MLNHAVSEFRTISNLRAARGAGSGLTLIAWLGLAMTLLASNAQALPGIDLSEALEPVAEGECPRLIQIKYPFLSCSNGQIGQSDADENWDNSRRMPQQSEWNEGDAFWGPSPN